MTDTSLTPETLMHRLPDLHVAIASDGTLRITARGSAYDCGSHGLAVLDVFARPRTLSEALGLLRARVAGMQDWMDMTGTIHGLFKAGILVDKNTSRPMVSAAAGFGSMPIHVAMLNDRRRTEGYLRAIREVVREGDVVLDIGTGTGVLSVAAAMAGARRVYAVEAGAMADVAEAVFRANGVADRVKLLRGWSTQLELPEPADVLISEIIGSEPLSERVIEATRDAVARLLKPEARLIPSALRVYGLPVTVPRSDIRERYVTDENMNEWRQRYGISFDPMCRAAADGAQKFYAKPHGMRDWPRLGPPALLAWLDLKRLQGNSTERREVIAMTVDGMLSGVAVYFEADLSDGVRISTHPEQTDTHCSWAMPIWSLPEPTAVRAGDKIAVTYAYNVPGEEDGMVSVTLV